MFLIFIPGIFYKVHLPEKKKKEKNQLNLAVLHIFIKLNHFSYMLSICLFLVSTQRVKG